MRKAALDTAITRGLRYLAAKQKTDGGFNSFSSPSLQPFKLKYTYQTSFVPALILSALAGTEEAATIRNRLADFLLKQKSPNWSYNYWARSSPQARTQPYPDDLDDTFCALGALTAHQPNLQQQGMLAAAVKMLIATETKPGGPYRTWLVTTDSQPVWLDTDVAVNANIAWFLSLANEPLSPLVSWLDKALAGKLRSPYYPSDIPIFYYLSRGYAGQKEAYLITQLKGRCQRARQPIDQALLLSSLLRLKAPVRSKSIERLIKAQRKNGSWPAAAFCLDPARDGQVFYHGAAELSTAFVLEALALYRANSQPKSQASQLDPTDRVLDLLATDCAQLPAELGQPLHNFATRVARAGNGEEIIGLPFLFNQSLKVPVTDNALVSRLALANLYGWAAYTIYDDFIDEEGQPALLPVANAAHRRSLHGLEMAVADTAFVHKTFDTIDAANEWELRHCRWSISNGRLRVGDLPDFANRATLADRSLGHVLGPVALLAAAGQAAESPQSRTVQRALRHYLIARQLNDDAHDWQEDLRRGQITYVVSEVLHEAGIKPGNRQLATLLPRLQRQFWHHTLPLLCETMRRHLRLSRQALKASQLFTADNPLHSLVMSLEESVHKTERTQAQAKQFLKQYRS